jgi:hypothetical protein
MTNVLTFEYEKGRQHFSAYGDGGSKSGVLRVGHRCSCTDCHFSLDIKHFACEVGIEDQHLIHVQNVALIPSLYLCLQHGNEVL